jgi:hypothetical protein
MKIVPGESVKGLLLVKVPQYLLLFSENKPGYLLNTGFIFEQIDLCLSSSGTGSYWLGLTKPKKGRLERRHLNLLLHLLLQS